MYEFAELAVLFNQARGLCPSNALRHRSLKYRGPMSGVRSGSSRSALSPETHDFWVISESTRSIALAREHRRFSCLFVPQSSRKSEGGRDGTRATANLKSAILCRHATTSGGSISDGSMRGAKQGKQSYRDRINRTGLIWDIRVVLPWFYGEAEGVDEGCRVLRNFINCFSEYQFLAIRIYRDFISNLISFVFLFLIYIYLYYYCMSFICFVDTCKALITLYCLQALTL